MLEDKTREGLFLVFVVADPGDELGGVRDFFTFPDDFAFPDRVHGGPGAEGALVVAFFEAGQVARPDWDFFFFLGWLGWVVLEDWKS